MRRAIEGEVLDIYCYNLVAGATPVRVYKCGVTDDNIKVEFRIERQVTLGADQYIYIGNKRNSNTNNSRSINFFDENPFIITPVAGKEWYAWSPNINGRLQVIERRSTE